MLVGGPGGERYVPPPQMESVTQVHEAAHVPDVNLTQFEALRAPTTPQTDMLHVDAIGTSPRTLVYGYTLDRDTFHAYVFDGEIHVVTYQGHYDDSPAHVVRHLHGTQVAFDALVPSKRAYPNRTDYGFAVTMRAAGFPLSFTTWDPEPQRCLDDPYWGLVLDAAGMVRREA